MGLWACGCLVGVLVAIGFGAALRLRAMHHWHEFTCQAQLKTLGMATTIYVNDHGDRLPPGPGQFADYICQGLPRGMDWDYVEHGPPAFHCPLDPDQEHLQRITNSELNADSSCRCSYDSRLAYPPVPDQPDGIEPCMWDIDGGGPQSPRANHRHGSDSFGNVVYFDGHVRRVPSAKWPSANWPVSDAEAHRRQFGR